MKRIFLLLAFIGLMPPAADDRTTGTIHPHSNTTT